MAENKINMNKDAKGRIPKTRDINYKNIGKLVIGAITTLLVIIFAFSFFENDKKNETRKEKDEDVFERNLNSELEKQEYSNSRMKAVEEKLNEVEDDPLADEEAYNTPAEPDPIEEFIKQQELEKIKRHYEARSSGFKPQYKNEISYENYPHDGIYTNNNGLSDSDYMKYITSGIDASANPNMQKEKIQFLKNSAVSNFVLKELLTPSLSKYEVKAGTYIPVTISVGIDSDLPSGFQAIVRENVYDTNTGTELLIPMGSKVFGQYSSEVSWGQTRIQAVFNRITFPNGKSINLESMGLTDLDGKAGLDANVDLRLGKVFGSIVMAAVIGAGQGVLTNNGNRNKDQNVALSGAGVAGGEQTIEIADKYTNKLIDVQPKLTKEFGGRANIIVDKDIILERYDKEIKYITN